MGYETVETLLDDVSRQMASSNLTKYSRGSAGQRGGAGSIRIAKSNSTSNSPRGSIGLGRRRTVMTDRRRNIMADRSLASAAGFVSNDGLQTSIRSSRPVSWHPSTRMALQPQYQPACQVPTLQTKSDSHYFDLPTTPAVYSAYASPDSTFSPLSLPYFGFEQDYSHQGNSATYQSHQVYESHQQAAETTKPYYSTQSENMDSSLHSHMDWSNFATNGFEITTSPATPDFYLPLQHPEGSLPADDAIPYHSFSDSESDGEILQGLGLYDSPEITKSPPTVSQFDSYGALVMSQVLGTPYRKTESESTGKGLKLEETWNPPSDDEGDDETDDEQDGDGEDEDEDAITLHSNAKDLSSQGSDAFMDPTNVVPNGLQANQGLHSSWL